MSATPSPHTTTIIFACN